MHTDNNRCVSFVTKKEKMTRNTRYAASRGSSSWKNETTRTGRIHRKRRCCCILATTIRRAPPFLSFFLHPLFSSFFSILHRYALPQQPSSLWGTHYRCFFHVISKPHTPFRATLYTRRLSICGPTWIVYFLSFFALFVFFFFFVFSTPLILFPFVSQRVETSLAYFESLISDRIFIRIFIETYIPYKIRDINYKFYSYRISIRIHIHLTKILALFQIVRLEKLFDKRARIFLVPLSSCIFLVSSDRLVFICTSAE